MGRLALDRDVNEQLTGWRLYRWPPLGELRD
jgi:hypothetical protein